MQHPQAKVGEVAHPAGTPQNGPQAAIEPFGPAVARTADEVVGDLLHPVLQRLVELLQCLEAQPSAPLAPLPQSPHRRLRPGHPAILEDSPQRLPVLGQTPQFRKLPLQCFQLPLLLGSEILRVAHPQPPAPLQLPGPLLVQPPLNLPPRLRQPILEVLHYVEAVDDNPHAPAEYFLGRFHVPIPHVTGHLLQLPQQPRRLARRQPRYHRRLLPALQYVQHPLVGVVDQNAAELPVLFFSDNSSIPSEPTALAPAAGARRLRSRNS